jgi:hypothetical protein
MWWQELHLVGPCHLLACGVHDDIAMSTLGGVVSYECGRPSRGCPELTMASGGAGGILDVGRAYVRGTGSDDTGC